MKDKGARSEAYTDTQLQEGRSHSDVFMIFDKTKPFQVQSLSVVPTFKKIKTQKKRKAKQTPLVAQPNTNQ